MFLTSEAVDRLKELTVPTVGEKAAQLLLELGREYPVPGGSFWAPVFDVQAAFGKLEHYRGDESFPDELMSDPVIVNLRWLAVASAADASELYWFLFDYFLPHGWLGKGAADGQITITITPSGRQEFSRLQQANLTSRIGFAAMSFQDEFKSLYDNGIEPGINAAGYETLLVDRTEHNNRINDEIVATIKRSRFVVADFSVNRGGIYFEAGFALGIGIPVIWLVKTISFQRCISILVNIISSFGPKTPGTVYAVVSDIESKRLLVAVR